MGKPLELRRIIEGKCKRINARKPCRIGSMSDEERGRVYDRVFRIRFDGADALRKSG
jgi:hypothetical protein